MNVGGVLMKLIIKDLPIDESEQHHNDRTNLK